MDVLSHPHKSRSRSFQALGLKERHAAELDARYEAEVEAALAGKASAGAGSGGGKGLGGQKLEDIDPEATAAAARQAAKSHARKCVVRLGVVWRHPLTQGGRCCAQGLGECSCCHPPQEENRVRRPEVVVASLCLCRLPAPCRFDDVVMSLKKKEEKHGVQLAAMQRTQEALQV